MNCCLQLLLVEDSEFDATLLLSELKRQHYLPLCTRVETREAFLDALENGSFDVVLCDYVLPQFDGAEALKLFRARGLDLPFIVVSGLMGEEKAVEMMKAGAHDYVMKQNLARLVPTLEREWEATQERRRRKRAEGAMLYLAAIVESSEDAIYGKNLDSLIASWNPAAERMFGYSAEEMIGRSTLALFPPGRQNELLDILSGLRRGETVSIPDTERVHKNGELVAVSVTVSPLKNSQGEIIGAASIARDLRPQKQAEREQQRLDRQLLAATKEVRALSGMLPICASCKRIRDDQGYWEQVETYLLKHADILFSHGLCPKCADAFEQDLQVNG